MPIPDGPEAPRSEPTQIHPSTESNQLWVWVWCKSVQLTNPREEIIGTGADHKAVRPNPPPLLKSPVTKKFQVQVAPTGTLGVHPANAALKFGA